MFEGVYNTMKPDVVYNAEYCMGGKCLVKKAVDTEDVSLGIVTARFPNGTIVRKHFAFFHLLGESQHTTLDIPLNFS